MYFDYDNINKKWINKTKQNAQFTRSPPLPWKTSGTSDSQTSTIDASLRSIDPFKKKVWNHKTQKMTNYELKKIVQKLSLYQVPEEWHWNYVKKKKIGILLTFCRDKFVILRSGHWIMAFIFFFRWKFAFIIFISEWDITYFTSGLAFSDHDPRIQNINSFMQNTQILVTLQRLQGARQTWFHEYQIS